VGKELDCLVCMYVEPRPGLDSASEAELEVLTVCNGQMVCLRHVPCAQPTYYATIRSGVDLESNGQMTDLDEYRRWIRTQTTDS
jgi:hypothetical protein